MRQFAKLLTILSLLVIVTNGCSVQDRASGAPHQITSSKSSLLRNHRILIAEYIRDRYPHVIRDIKITAPYERSGGIGRADTAVCVVISRDNPFGIIVKDYWVFRFDDDVFQPAALGMEPCEPLTSFPELMLALTRRQGR